MPTLKKIRAIYKDAEFVLITSSVGSKILCNTIDFDDVIIINRNELKNLHKHPIKFFEVLSIIKRFKFDLVIHSYEELSNSYILSYLSRIPRRVGYNSKIAKAQLLLNETIPFDKKKNVVDINYDIVRYLASKNIQNVPKVKIEYTLKTKNTVKKYIEKIGIGFNEKFILIQPFSNMDYKAWGLDKYAILAQKIESQIGIPVIFVSINEIKNKLIKNNIFNLTIEELACLLDLSVLFIGNNSGPRNMAVVQNTPTITIQGPSPKQWDVYWEDVLNIKMQSNDLDCIPCEKFAEYVPGKCHNYSYLNGCMKDISIAEVFEKVKLYFGE